MLGHAFAAEIALALWTARDRLPQQMIEAALMQ
jgi:hypothetical protein